MVIELDVKVYDKIRQAIKDRVKSIEGSFLILAKLLFFVKERQLYKRWGYETFTDYVEMDLSLPKHKAQYFVSICTAMKKLPLTDQDVKELGLEKVKQIVKLQDTVDRDTFIQIKEKAKGESIHIVESKIKKLKNTIPALDIKTEELVSELLSTTEESLVNCSMRLFESVYDLFENTVLRAQEICQTSSKNVAIDYICQVFNATVTKKGSEHDLIAIVKNLERTFKVKIVIVKGQEVIYGKE